MIIPVNTNGGKYNIYIERGCLSTIGNHINLDRKVLIVTDDGVPESYSKTVASQCRDAYIETILQGEDSKTLSSYERLLRVMLENNFSRNDCVISVGGGMIGDLSGFVASSYMRGIDFYNVPTTMLSQIDSSIGGKVAVNFCGIKNIVGAFYQPKAVFIDGNLLKTLSDRQIASGLCEAVKMSLTSDEKLFSHFENEEIDIDHVTEKALLIKKYVVEEDEKESDLRKILNFGHTIGHGIESVCHQNLYHGECVALGMLPMCSPDLRPRVKKVLDKLGLPTVVNCNRKEAVKAIAHDKKSGADGIEVILVSEPGSFEMKKMTLEEIEKISECCFEVE